MDNKKVVYYCQFELALARETHNQVMIRMDRIESFRGCREGTIINMESGDSHTVTLTYCQVKTLLDRMNDLDFRPGGVIDEDRDEV